MYRCFDVQTLIHTDVWMFAWFNVQIFFISFLQIFRRRYSDAQTYRCFKCTVYMRLCRCLDVQTLICTDVYIFRCTDALMFQFQLCRCVSKCFDVQMFLDVQTFRCADINTYRCFDFSCMDVKTDRYFDVQRCRCFKCTVVYMC